MRAECAQKLRGSDSIGGDVFASGAHPFDDRQERRGCMRAFHRLPVDQAELAAQPYGERLLEARIPLPEPETPDLTPIEPAVLRACGLTREELQLVLGPMQREGLEPVGSMGDDTPLAVL